MSTTKKVIDSCYRWVRPPLQMLTVLLQEEERFGKFLMVMPCNWKTRNTWVIFRNQRGPYGFLFQDPCRSVRCPLSPVWSQARIEKGLLHRRPDLNAIQASPQPKGADCESPKVHQMVGDHITWYVCRLPRNHQNQIYYRSNNKKASFRIMFTLDILFPSLYHMTYLMSKLRTNFSSFSVY